MWQSSNGKITLKINYKDAVKCSHLGDCYQDVLNLANIPTIKEQLDTINVQDLREELEEYGAWSNKELADHQHNKLKLLWLACGDIVDNYE